MSVPLKIVGIAGSLRAQSYSKMVLDSVAQLLPKNSHFSTIDIGELPHYNEDLDGPGLPAAVASARAQVAASDAVIIITPEFNHGLPGVLKNTLDWLSRPAFDSCMVSKPVFFATLSPGALGGVRAQYQLRETLSSMLCQLFPMPEVAITHVGDKMAEGRLSDPATLTFLARRIEQFMSAVQAK
jgi:chromate reductase, NAD(P)H dehydrogenase (quinone)